MANRTSSDGGKAWGSERAGDKSSRRAPPASEQTGQLPGGKQPPWAWGSRRVGAIARLCVATGLAAQGPALLGAGETQEREAPAPLPHGSVNLAREV